MHGLLDPTLQFLNQSTLQSPDSYLDNHPITPLARAFSGSDRSKSSSADLSRFHPYLPPLQILSPAIQNMAAGKC
jgi:hypothetical protein